MFRRLALLFPAVVGLAALLAASAPAGPQAARYIVVLNGSVASPAAVAAEHAQRFGARPDFVYGAALKGYAATLPARAVAALKADPRVAYVEADQVVTVAAQTIPTGIERIFATGNAGIGIDGVDDKRIDADVAIIDTGIDHTHPDLNVHARTDCSGGSPFKSSCANDSGTDGHGHGTHVAGTAAAIDNGTGVVGVAPGARLWAVKVLGNNGSGYTSWIIAGIDWVTARAGQIEVANMSLGCECSSAAQDQAIANSVAKGVVYVVAAGNSAKDASTFSPANHPDVITVSALADFDGKPGGLASPTCRTDTDDTLANFSNFGSLVDIAAPGVCILSTWTGGAYSTISGTSMASPHVAGAAALLTSVSKPTSKSGVNAVRAKLRDTGNFDWTDTSGDGIKEPLLDVSNSTVYAPKTVAGSGGGGGGNQAPTASFTHGCSGLGCSFDGSASSDPDGSIASYAWTFGDGSSGSGATVSHTYASDGTYTVALTVTDDQGATGTASQSVTVSSGSSGGITLSATGYKVQGLQKADLSWSGATSTSIDVFRNGTRIATVANTGAYTDNINVRGPGTYLYRVCHAGTSTCSNEATVSF